MIIRNLTESNISVADSLGNIYLLIPGLSQTPNEGEIADFVGGTEGLEIISEAALKLATVKTLEKMIGGNGDLTLAARSELLSLHLKVATKNYVEGLVNG